jgi:hypothetical protein
MLVNLETTRVLRIGRDQSVVEREKNSYSSSSESEVGSAGTESSASKISSMYDLNFSIAPAESENSITESP